MPTPFASSRQPPGVVTDESAPAAVPARYRSGPPPWLSVALLVAGSLGYSSAAVTADDDPAEAVSADDVAEQAGDLDAAAPDDANATERRSRRDATSPGWERRGDYAVLGGDILLGKVTPDGKLESALAQRGLGHSRLLDRWPDGIVPYELDERMTGEQRDRVKAAIEHWTDNTRISFAERGTERADVYPNWVRFIPENGCASYVGRATFPGNQPYEGQPLYANNCTVGSIIHEIGHAIGLYHEHTRPDRDNFIAVDLAHVVSGREHNFDIVFTNTQTYGAYDYGSIMHYGARFFSESGEPTIIAPPDEPIGQRVELSAGDILAVDRMYATDLSLAVDSTQQDVTDGSGATVAGLVIDAAVRNIGSLGAHDVSLTFSLGDSARWLSVTEDSGWECLPEGADLVCLRDTLAESDTSRFELHADPRGADAGDLVATLSSRTLDLDESNNGGNAGKVEALATREDDSRTAEPERGAASPQKAEPLDQTTTGNVVAQASAPSGSPSSGPSGGSGAGGPLLLALLALLRVARRRQDPRAGRHADRLS